MASKYWIKLYHEIIHDPKMGRLPDHLWRRAIELFLLAGENGDDGSLPPVKDMAWTLRIDETELAASLAELAVVNIINEQDGQWFVTHFAQRQSPASNAERTQRHRDRKRKEQYTCNETLQPGNETETDRNTEPDPDPETNKETETESKPVASAPSDDSPPTTPVIFNDWKILIKESKNRSATLREMFGVLYPDHELPSYGKIGKVAKRLTASRLAELLWQHSTRPPTGDVLDYVQGVAKHSALRRNGQQITKADRQKYATDPPPDQSPPIVRTESEHQWIQVLTELRLQLTRITVDEWLADSHLLERTNGRAVIQVKDSYAVDWCTGRLKKPIQRTLSGVLGEEVEVEFVAAAVEDGE